MLSLSLGSRTSVGFFSFILGIILSTGLQYAFAWTGPTQAPPNGNTDTPLNVSAVDQTKAGSLTLGVSVLSPVFVDSNNTGYRVDPNGTSVVNELYSYGAIYSQARNYSKTDDWALTTYTAAGGNNSEPGQARGSLYVNDIYVRAIPGWLSTKLSQLSAQGGGSCYGLMSSTPMINGEIVMITGTSGSQWGWSPDYAYFIQCLNGKHVPVGSLYNPASSPSTG